MPDEHEGHEHMSELEMMNAMSNMAKMGKAQYDGWIEQGFEPIDAFKLLAAWVHGSAGGKYN